MKNLNKFSKILAEDCDLEKYTETLCEGINYGKNIKLSKYQKALFLSLQRMYAETLCLSKALDEAQRFLNEEWVGDKKVDFASRVYYNKFCRQMFRSPAAKFSQTVTVILRSCNEERGEKDV